MSSAYVQLFEAIALCDEARACISQNRGYDKDLAREGFECAVTDELLPALLSAIDQACGDLDAGDVLLVAKLIEKLLRKNNAIGL